MRKKATSLVKHPLISGSIVIFLGTFLGNVINFIFSLFMLSKLSNADYGTLIALVSLITLPGLAASAITPSVVNFAASYFANNDLEHVAGLYRVMFRIYFLIGIFLFIGILLLTPFLSEFFSIHNFFLFLLVAIAILINLFVALNNSFLQAKLAFTYISFNSILSSVIKFFVGALLVIAGYSVGGALVGIVLSFLIPLLATFIPLSFIITKASKQVKVQTRELIDYGIPSALVVLGITSFITADVLLVKHFFSSDNAGFYAGMSVIGRVIFYFSAPIGTVMFPLIVQKRSKKEKFMGTFLLSVFLILIPSVCITLLYFLAPDFIIQFFHVKKTTAYQKDLLGYFGIFVTLYAILSVIINFFLTIKMIKIWIPVCLAAFVQIMSIWFFHNDFKTIVLLSSMTLFLLLISLLIYYVYAEKKK